MKRELKIGLTLGGGGARGFAHLGVIQRLQELGVSFHCISGTSIGAIIGGILAAGTLDRAFAWCNEPDWKKWPKLLFESRPSAKALIKGKGIENLLTSLIPAQRFEDLAIPFAAVATDLHTGEAVTMREGDLISAISASMTIPGVFRPIEREGRVLVDGGLVDPLPIAACRALGADRVIAVDINPPDEHPPTPFEKLTLVDVLMDSFRIFNVEMTRHTLTSDPPDVLVSPAVGDVMMLDFRNAQALIERGRQAVDEAAIVSLLNA